jgi:MFS family permease
MLTAYRDLFALRPYRFFWLGATASALGDAATRVALTWLVYARTGSVEALGWLMVAYTGPVLVGGFAAGYLLDRFDRRRVLQVDALLRGLVVASVPAAQALGALTLPHVYAVAAVHGLLMMVPLAGGPSIVPSLVPRERLAAANALEMLSFTLSGVLGPLLAGLLIERVGAANVVLVDAASYGLFALGLSVVPRRDAVAAGGAPGPAGFGEAARLLVGSPLLLATTLMFMAFNLGAGALFVGLPLLADRLPGGGPELYGVLLGLYAAGQVGGALAAGGLAPRSTPGRLICAAQALAGGAVALLLVAGGPLGVGAALLLFGALAGPLTVWAQTLRMAIIPERLRGRAFALLRTLMQSGSPLGGALGGALLPVVGGAAMLALSALIVGLPGLLGLAVRDLRAVPAPPSPRPAPAPRHGPATAPGGAGGPH